MRWNPYDEIQHSFRLNTMIWIGDFVDNVYHILYGSRHYNEKEKKNETKNNEKNQ